jgi:hypothetical protein
MTQVKCKESTLEVASPETKTDLLERVDAPIESTNVTLTSGRRYELRADGAHDQLTVRSTEGNIILRIEVTDAGPVLSFSGASIDLVATRKMRIEADEVSLHAKGDMLLDAGGSLRERVGGDHHTRVEGSERLEASAVELQANARSVAVRAMQKISLDGEHIGLNDEPLPQPFPWSTIAADSEESR